MPRHALVLALFGLPGLLAPTARAEPVYDFVATCKAEELGRCFRRIEQRLVRLNTGANRRICLPRAFGASMVESQHVPVSILDHVRLGLSAARFGSAGQDVDDVMTEIVSDIYRCE